MTFRSWVNVLLTFSLMGWYRPPVKVERSCFCFCVCYFTVSRISPESVDDLNDTVTVIIGGTSTLDWHLELIPFKMAATAKQPHLAVTLTIFAVNEVMFLKLAIVYRNINTWRDVAAILNENCPEKRRVICIPLMTATFFVFVFVLFVCCR